MHPGAYANAEMLPRGVSYAEYVNREGKDAYLRPRNRKESLSRYPRIDASPVRIEVCHPGLVSVL